MTAYERIWGHGPILERIEKTRLGDRVAHAYLFAGPDGIGKEKVARTFAMALNCQNTERAPCGECPACRLIERAAHPDVRWLACEEEQIRRGWAEETKGRNPSLQIRNEDLDGVLGMFRFHPYQGRMKVLGIVDAERMNLNCQNRFLKTLEEPNDASVIILLSSQADSLLPTIRSRCQTLRFGPLPRSLVLRHLLENLGLATERAEVIASLAGGSLGRAEALAGEDEEGALALRDEAWRWLKSTPGADLALLLDAAEEMGEGQEGREHLRALVEMLEFLCRDLLALHLGVSGARLNNPDWQAALEESRSDVSPNVLLRWWESLERTRQSMAANANPRMAAEALGLSLRMPAGRRETLAAREDGT